jgi:hypothetical protein
MLSKNIDIVGLNFQTLENNEKLIKIGELF